MAEDKIYTISLSDAWKKTRMKRTQYAVSLVKIYMKTHTKAKEVKLGKRLNEKMWERSMEKPPRRVRVKAVMDGETAKVELMGFEYEEFKAAPRKERKGLQEKLLARLGPKALQKEAESKLIEGKSEPTPAAKEIRAEEIKEDIEKEKTHSKEQ